jgi:putative flippase GtrA
MTADNRVNTRIKDLLGEDRLGMAKFARFLAVGLFNAFAGFLLFILFFRILGLHYLLANVLVFISWAWFGFELQRRWAFRVESSGVAFSRYLLNQIVFTLFGSVLLWILVEGLQSGPELAYLLTLGIVTLGIYVSSLLWVFRRTNQVCE